MRAALAHSQPDFTPCDYTATPEIHRSLLRHFGLGEIQRVNVPLIGVMIWSDDGVVDRLGCDIRYVNRRTSARPCPASRTARSWTFGEFAAVRWRTNMGITPSQVGTPYGAWTTVEEAEAFPWPDPDWFDYDAMPALLRQVPRLGHCCGRQSRARLRQ